MRENIDTALLANFLGDQKMSAALAENISAAMLLAYNRRVVD